VLASLLPFCQAQSPHQLKVISRLETCSGYFSLQYPDFHAKIGPKVALILGEEVDGIAAELREKLDVFVEIPMVGRKESFNVSVATGMILYELKCYNIENRS